MDRISRRNLGLFTTLALSVALTACGSGVEGIPVPQPIDMAHITRPETPNTALAAPAGFTPTPDIVTPVYDRSADELYAAVIAAAERQPRTYLLKRYDDLKQVHFVERIAVFGFPDLIAMQVLDNGPGHSRLVIWSRSVYGSWDFGVNRRRVQHWLEVIAGDKS